MLMKASTNPTERTEACGEMVTMIMIRTMLEKKHFVWAGEIDYKDASLDQNPLVSRDGTGLSSASVSCTSACRVCPPP
jgi:hypothetical protein